MGWLQFTNSFLEAGNSQLVLWFQDSIQYRSTKSKSQSKAYGGLILDAPAPLSPTPAGQNPTLAF